jgi:hypothetical protein
MSVRPSVRSPLSVVVGFFVRTVNTCGVFTTCELQPGSWHIWIYSTPHKECFWSKNPTKNYPLSDSFNSHGQTWCPVSKRHLAEKIYSDYEQIRVKYCSVLFVDILRMRSTKLTWPRACRVHHVQRLWRYFGLLNYSHVLQKSCSLV